MLRVWGTGSIKLPFLDYVKAHLQIPGIQNYNEGILLLAIPLTKYSEEVPEILGTRIIERVVSLITPEETEQLISTWKKAQQSLAMSQAVKSTIGHGRPGRRQTHCFSLLDVHGNSQTTIKVTVLLSKQSL